MLVAVSDACRWRVGKRRLPWKPDPWIVDFFCRVTNSLDEFAVLVFVPLFPVLLPVLVVYLLSWAVSCAIAPILALCRAWGLARAKVVAYPARIKYKQPQGMFTMWIKRTDRPGLYYAVVDVDEADALVTRVAAELREHGRPRLLEHVDRKQ